MKNNYKHDYSSISDKALRKLRQIFFRMVGGREKAAFFYPSYRHRNHSTKNADRAETSFYFTARPYYAAGFGHGLGSWRAGYIDAKVFDIEYAYYPMASTAWEEALGLGENEVYAPELLASGYKKVVLPYYNPSKDSDRELIKQIINSYEGKKIVFFNSEDQKNEGYSDEIGNDFIREKFWGSSARKSDRVLYDKMNINIAVHIRRGDVSTGLAEGNEKLRCMWLDNEYSVRLLDLVIEMIGADQPYSISLFSEGNREDFSEFEKYGKKVQFVLDGNPQDTFINMCYADILMTAPSSFSREAGNINRNLKIASDKQGGYPDNGLWVLADPEGTLHSGSESSVREYINNLKK